MSDSELRAEIVQVLHDFEDDLADALLIIVKQAFDLGEAAASPALLNRARTAEQAVQRVRAETAEAIAQAIEGQIYPAHALDGEACEDCLTMHADARIARQHAEGDDDE